jgi:4-hydroxybenzoate polyprenyltransferase
MRRVKPYLQLVRLPNLFTAAADPLAGWLLVGGRLVAPVGPPVSVSAIVGGLIPLVGAGVASYAAGMILNDVFDFEVDRVERPSRPLPSGRVSRKTAAVAGSALLILGMALALVAGTMSFLVAVALAVCILGYDGGLKRTLMGPQIMGACRSLNLLLGMSLAPGLGGPAGWLAAFAFGLFVTGVTWISRDEATAKAGQTRGVLVGMLVQNVALVSLVVAAGLFSPTPDEVPRFLCWGIGLAVLVATAASINRADLRALRETSPATLQAAVKKGVLSLIWLDVGIVTIVCGPDPAINVAVLWFPAILLGRWLYST